VSVNHGWDGLERVDNSQWLTGLHVCLMTLVLVIALVSCLQMENAWENPAGDPAWGSETASAWTNWNAVWSVDFYPLRYVTLYYVYVPNSTYACLLPVQLVHIGIFLADKFRYDAQMPGYLAQCLRRKKFIVAKGSKSSPFSIAE